MPDPPPPPPEARSSESGPVLSLRLIRLLALSALAVSSYLLGVSLHEHGRPVGCGAGSGCESVLASAWSSWLGIPVSFAAVSVYLLVFTISLMLGPGIAARRQRLAWRMLLALAVMTTGGVVWFIALQALVIKRFCVFCVADHAIGLAMATIIFFSAPVRRRTETLQCVFVGLLAVAVLVGGQVAYRPRMLRVMLMDGRIALNAAAYPAIGDPHAPHVLVSLADYTCPHCRAMHGYLMEAMKRYGNQVAVLVLPTPLDSTCNPYVTETEPIHKDACGLARLAVAVWLAAPEKFSKYDAWLFGPETPRTLTDARTQAASLVGSTELDRAMADPRVDEIIRHDIKLHHDTGGPDGIYERLPKVLTSGTILSGEPGSAAEVFEALEKDAGLHAPHP